MTERTFTRAEVMEIAKAVLRENDGIQAVTSSARSIMLDRGTRSLRLHFQLSGHKSAGTFIVAIPPDVLAAVASEMKDGFGVAAVHIQPTEDWVGPEVRPIIPIKP